MRVPYHERIDHQKVRNCVFRKVKKKLRSIGKKVVISEGNIIRDFQDLGYISHILPLSGSDIDLDFYFIEINRFTCEWKLKMEIAKCIYEILNDSLILGKVVKIQFFNETSKRYIRSLRKYIEVTRIIFIVHD